MEILLFFPQESQKCCKIKAMSEFPGQTWELFNSSWSANIWAALQKLLWFPHNHRPDKEHRFCLQWKHSKSTLLPDTPILMHSNPLQNGVKGYEEEMAEFIIFLLYPIPLKP